MKFVSIGEAIVVGTTINNKFNPVGFPAKVSNIIHLSGERIKITLDWGQYGNSFVWLHDENKTWVRASKFN